MLNSSERNIKIKLSVFDKTTMMFYIYDYIGLIFVYYFYNYNINKS